MPDERIEKMQDELLALNEQVQSIQAMADSEDRELTEDELKDIKALSDKFEDIEARIEQRERISEQNNRLLETFGRKTEPQQPEPQNAPRQVQQSQRTTEARIQLLEDKGKWGWKNMGEFAMSVRHAANNAGNIDPRLIANAPTTWSSEGTGADGGFAVPPDFRQEIVEKVMGEDSLLGRTDQMTTTSNSMTFPKDETTDWDDTGGIQAYWEGEGSAITQSKLALQEESLRLNKLTALIPVTEELMEDAAGLDSYLRRRVPRKFDFKIQDSIVNGTGVGKPTGFMNSSALVTVAKEAAQTADTVVYANIVKMWSRMYSPSRSTAVWLINQDIEPQLLQMSFDASSTVPAYMPANGLSGAPYATLMGRPVIPLQAMQTLGDFGDIALVDLSQYLTVTKVGGIRSDVSIHLFFDYDMAAYRFIMRLAGKPWWSAPITPKNSANTLSAFVSLAERA